MCQQCHCEITREQRGEKKVLEGLISAIGGECKIKKKKEKVSSHLTPTNMPSKSLAVSTHN